MPKEIFSESIHVFSNGKSLEFELNDKFSFTNNISNFSENTNDIFINSEFQKNHQKIFSRIEDNETLKINDEFTNNMKNEKISEEKEKELNGNQNFSFGNF